MVWAANEGQSDYFASHSCAREMWKSEPEMNAKFRTKVLPFAQKVCDTNFANQSERDICYRSSVAGMSLATLLAKLRQSPAPKFETPTKLLWTSPTTNTPKRNADWIPIWRVLHAMFHSTKALSLQRNVQINLVLMLSAMRVEAPALHAMAGLQRSVRVVGSNPIFNLKDSLPDNLSGPMIRAIGVLSRAKDCL